MNKQKDNLIYHFTLNAPTLKDNTGDMDRLIHQLKLEAGVDEIRFDFNLLHNLSDKIREWRYRLKCLMIKDGRIGHLIDIFSEHHPEAILGIAIDLGTSRVACRIVNLETHSSIAEFNFENPQTKIGLDVLTRMHSADQEKGLETLQNLIIAGINQQITHNLSSQINQDQIYVISLAGNTCMTHLVLGLSPHYLFREPYIPAINQPGFILAKNLGFKINDLGTAFIFPNIGAYFGGDLIAGILYADLRHSEAIRLLVDVGTNAEVVLGDKNWLIACAGAAGPALESGVTKMGMMAGPGVIDRVQIDPQTKKPIVRTIDDLPAIGVCGSALIDLAAQLFKNQMLSIQGKFMPSSCPAGFIKKNEIDHFILVSNKESGLSQPILISQVDMDSLVRSKAAMYTILETLAQSIDIQLSDIDRFYVAGTFGSFIQPESAISIGMLPDLPLSKFQVLGNSSLEGASTVLNKQDVIQEIKQIRDMITYVELNVNQDFMQRFSAAKFIPHTDLNLFPSFAV